jgi:hypothetical protein
MSIRRRADGADGRNNRGARAQMPFAHVDVCRRRCFVLLQKRDEACQTRPDRCIGIDDAGQRIPTCHRNRSSARCPLLPFCRSRAAAVTVHDGNLRRSDRSIAFWLAGNAQRQHVLLEFRDISGTERAADVFKSEERRSQQRRCGGP